MVAHPSSTTLVAAASAGTPRPPPALRPRTSPRCRAARRAPGRRVRRCASASALGGAVDVEVGEHRRPHLAPVPGLRGHVDAAGRHPVRADLAEVEQRLRRSCSAGRSPPAPSSTWSGSAPARRGSPPAAAARSAGCRAGARRRRRGRAAAAGRSRRCRPSTLNEVASSCSSGGPVRCGTREPRLAVREPPGGCVEVVHRPHDPADERHHHPEDGEQQRGQPGHHEPAAATG